MNQRDETKSPWHSLINTTTWGFLLLSFIYVSFRVLLDYQGGGNPWKQGDWLINNEAGPIRRGLFGSGLLSIGDYFNVSPLLLVSATQIGILAILFVSFGLLVAQVRDLKLRAILILSPAIFTIFWAVTPDGSVRKELIAFSGLSLIALGALRANRWAFWLGTLLFSLSMVAHEAMVLFLPTFIAIGVLTGVHKTAPAHALASVATIFSVAIFVTFYTIANAQVADTSGMCLALVSRGLDEAICDGAIKWLSYTGYDGLNFVLQQLNPRNVVEFLIGYGVSLLPLGYIVWLGPKRKANFVAVALLALPFVPLYFIAIDWGRWISFHLFSAVVLLCCAMAKDNFEVRRPPPTPHVIALLTIAFLISPSALMPLVWGGAVSKLITGLARLLG